MSSLRKNRQISSWVVWVLGFLTILFFPQMTHAVVLGTVGSDLSVTSVSGIPGSTVSVSVLGDFSQAVNSVQFNLQFDPNLLSISSVAAGSADSSWTVVENPNTPGVVTVGMFNSGGAVSTLSGPQQQIAFITFTVNNTPGSSAASCALAFSNIIFDTTRVSQLTNGTFTIIPANYTLTVSVSGNGVVSAAPNSASYQAGSQVILTASPSLGYQFSSWTGDVSGAINPLTLTMNVNKSVVANFILQTETITASAGTGGSISPAGVTSVNYGASQKFTVTPNTGYSVNTVLVDGSPVTLDANNSYILTNVTSTHTISATFTHITYTITASAGSNGSISPSGVDSVNYGGSQVYTITPNTGYQIANVTVNGTALTNTPSSYTFSGVTTNQTVSAAFSLIPTVTYTLGITASNGTVAQSVNGVASSGPYNAGTVVALTAIAASGYQFSSWSGALSGTSDPATITMSTNQNVTANFTPIIYTITSSASSGGVISPAGTTNVNYGASQTFTVKPNKGYSASLMVDGKAVALTNNKYTFRNVTIPHTIAASFKHVRSRG